MTTASPPNGTAAAGPDPDSRRPLVVACLNVADLRPDVDPLTGSIRLDRFRRGLSAPDTAALEHALRLSEAWSGKVLAVAAGPPAIDGVLREVSALGISVVRIPNQGNHDGPDREEADIEALGGDERQLARAIASAISRWGTPSIVLCGDRSADRGTGALPAFVAHELGVAQALGLVSLIPHPDSTAQAPAVLAERRLDGGWRERLRVPLPAVCSVEGAGVRLRRASLAAALAAGSSTIAVDSGRTPPVGADGTDRRVRVGPPRPFRPRARVLPPPEGDDPRIRLLALTGALVAHDPPHRDRPGQCRRRRRRAARISGPPRVPGGPTRPRGVDAIRTERGRPVNRLDAMTWPEAGQHTQSGAVLLLPVGSTEQHGPHLPLTTDTDIAVAIAMGAAHRRDQLVVAPALAYGSAGEHQEFSGTLSIGGSATETVLVELGRSAAHDYAHVVLVSTHGGNAEPVAAAVARLTGEGKSVSSWSPRWPGDLHAGRTETSLMLAIAPDRVHLDRAEAGDLRPLDALLPLLRRHGVRPVSANGVLGDPGGADPADGRALLAMGVDQLVDMVDPWLHDSRNRERRDGAAPDEGDVAVIYEVATEEAVKEVPMIGEVTG